MPVKITDPCARHNLWFARAPWPSADGRLMYVVCGCGRHRQVSAAAWQAEAARRAKAQGKGTP
jgi:hypothetical protein